MYPVEGAAAGKNYNQRLDIVGAGSARTTTDLPDGESVIRNRVGQCEETIGTILQHIDHLENRLDVALTPSMPSMNKDRERLDAPTPIMSPLCARLLSLNETMTIAVARLNQIRMRVEI